MGALPKAVHQTLARLRDVTLSQKIALALGGALVAVSLLSLVHWAATPELVPLLPQDLSLDELAAVRAGLEQTGEKYEIRGTRVYIPAAANRESLLARLHQDGQLPANTSLGFAELLKESDPWASQSENERRWIVGLQSEIEGVLQQFQGVQGARVFLNLNTGGRRFTRVAPPKSASVTLIMEGGERVPPALARAAARLVAGAVQGLDVRNVEVLDAAGAPAWDHELERDPTNQLSQLLAQVERRYKESLRNLLAADPKALISVQVDLNTTASKRQTDQPLPPVIVNEEIEREETTRVHRREAPGVQPNTGVAIGSGGADESHMKEHTRSESTPGMARTVEDTPAGEIEQVTAAIALSSSYLESVFRRSNPAAADPTPAELEQVFQRERGRLLPQLALLVKPQDEKYVALSYYFDGTLEPATDGAGDGLHAALNLMQAYGPQSALALLALVSLGLMLRMARRGGEGDSFGLELGLPEEAIEAARRAAGDVSLVAAETRGARGPRGGRRGRGGGVPMVGADGEVIETDMVGPIHQASATEGMLVAQEVDANTVQIRKMIDQIGEMVESDPDVVSTLIEQWVQKNEQYHEG